MKLGKLSLGIAAVALAASPVVAQAVFAPAVAPLDGEESELTSTATIIVGLVAVGAVVVAVGRWQQQLGQPDQHLISSGLGRFAKKGFRYAGSPFWCLPT